MKRGWRQKERKGKKNEKGVRGGYKGDENVLLKCSRVNK